MVCLNGKFELYFVIAKLVFTERPSHYQIFLTVMSFIFALYGTHAIVAYIIDFHLFYGHIS